MQLYDLLVQSGVKCTSVEDFTEIKAKILEDPAQLDAMLARQVEGFRKRAAEEELAAHELPVLRPPRPLARRQISDQLEARLSKRPSQAVLVERSIIRMPD